MDLTSEQKSYDQRSNHTILWLTKNTFTILILFMGVLVRVMLATSIRHVGGFPGDASQRGGAGNPEFEARSLILAAGPALGFLFLEIGIFRLAPDPV
jgi:hypothetical protein